MADDGKIRHCIEGDTTWTDCLGDAVTTTGVVTTFLRILDKVLILNGTDALGFVDLATWTVDHYDSVANPTNAPTAAATGITASGSYLVYYSVTWNSTVGETANGPILTQAVSKSRDQWKSDGTEYLTISRNNTAPAGATSWNLYIALAKSGATIANTDMLPLAQGIDLAVTSFVDNGSISINLSAGTAPDDNSTTGPKAKYARESEGRPILYGVTDDPYAIYIGGDGDKALDFSPNNGGFRLVLNEGTNYFPTSVIGFRNGQGVPSITVLFTNTEGLSKQSIVEQNTVTFGTFSFVVWGQTEQNYGTAGVASPYSMVNYRGGLYFLSADGVVKGDTAASLQNVLSFTRISDPIEDYVSQIKANRLDQTVGTGWDNKIYMTVPSLTADENNKIIVYDIANKDLAAWYAYDIAAQWIGTITPSDDPAFVYICQDNHILKLVDAYVAQDEDSSGTVTSFPVELSTGIMSANTAHNGFTAVVQVVVYLIEFVGSVDITIRYRNMNGNWRYKTKTFSRGLYSPSTEGNWSSSGYLYNQVYNTNVLRWGEIDVFSNSNTSTKGDKRCIIPINDITNEVQVSLAVNLDNTGVVVRSISIEGQALGVAPDIK